MAGKRVNAWKGEWAVGRAVVRCEPRHDRLRLGECQSQGTEWKHSVETVVIQRLWAAPLSHHDVLVNCLMLLRSPWRKFQAQSWCWAGVSICLIIHQLIHQSAHFCALFISKPEDPKSTTGLVVCRKGQVQGFSRLDIAIFFQYCTLVGL